MDNGVNNIDVRINDGQAIWDCIIMDHEKPDDVHVQYCRGKTQQAASQQTMKFLYEFAEDLSQTTGQQPTRTSP